MMNVLIALSAFKGSIKAAQACSAVARGLQRGFKKGPNQKFPFAPLKIVKFAISDGGDGFLDSVAAGFKLRSLSIKVRGALGHSITSEFLIGMVRGKKTALIETAKICGLAQVSNYRRNPMKTTSYGLGEAIRLALDQRVDQIFIGLGGSATQDAGSGMAQALGYKLLDGSGLELGLGAGPLKRLKRIDCSRRDPRLATTKVYGLCDVTNPLLGKHGTARVYAPQKGASPRQVEIIERNLRNWSKIMLRDLGRVIAKVQGGGAAGGLGAGMMGFCGGTLLPGTETILRLLGAKSLIESADIIFVGEGRLDFQTPFGKAPAVVSHWARKAGKRVFGLFGQIEPRQRAKLAKALGLERCVALKDLAPSPQEAMARASPLLTQAAQILAKGFLPNSYCGRVISDNFSPK